MESYQPQSNAMSEFTRQLAKTEDATMSLRREVQSLGQRLKGTPDDVLQQKLEYLQGAVSSSQAMNRALELKHVGIKQEYADLTAFPVVDGTARLHELNEVYGKMTELLSLVEGNIYKILGTPTTFFRLKLLRYKLGWRHLLSKPRWRCSARQLPAVPALLVSWR